MLADDAIGDAAEPADDRAAESLQNAEAAAALARERADAARARADELRRQAEAQRDGAGPTRGVQSTPPHPVKRSMTTLVTVIATIAVVASGALIAVGVLIMREHGKVTENQRLATEFSTAARQSVVNLMSLDFNQADDIVARVIDNATGKFKEDYQAQSADLIEGLKQSKVVTKVAVKLVAVESMSQESAVVLVAARSEATNVSDPRGQPQDFRIALTLTRDGGQLKMSNVDFVT